MNADAGNDEVGDSLGPPTAPDGFGISARGFSSEAEARELATTIGYWIQGISRAVDLSHLDGVTVACDYHQALTELDRGYQTSHKLKASEAHAVGVAMTPAVIRNGVLKSHIVFNAATVAPILDPQHIDFDVARHLIAHECAHVEVTHKFDAVFPGVLLRRQYRDSREAHRWDVILGCWNEYAATRRSAAFGHNPTGWYEETLLTQMEAARGAVTAAIDAFRGHGNPDQLFDEAFNILGTLLKLAAYLQGTLDGLAVALSERAEFVRTLAGHWFEPFFLQLHEANRSIADGYGEWKDQTAFQAIGDIAERLLAAGGIVIKNDGFYLNPP